MAQLDVEKKESNDWWKWLLGILAAIAIIWIIVESTGNDDVDTMDDDLRETRIDTTASLENSPVANYDHFRSELA